MCDGSDIGIQVAIVLGWQCQRTSAVVERNGIARKLFRVFVLLAEVDAVLQVNSNCRLVQETGKICATLCHHPSQPGL